MRTGRKVRRKGSLDEDGEIKVGNGLEKEK